MRFGVYNGLPPRNGNPVDDSWILAEFIAPSGLRSNRVAMGMGDSLLLTRVSKPLPYQRWELDVTIKPQDGTAPHPALAFIYNRNRSFKPDYLRPGSIWVRPLQPARMVSNPGTAVEANQVLTQPPGTTTIFSKDANAFNVGTGMGYIAGDLINLFDTPTIALDPKHDKVYMVVNYDDNTGMLTIFPGLVRDLVGIVMILTGSKLSMRCMLDSQAPPSLDFADGILSAPAPLILIENLTPRKEQ